MTDESKAADLVKSSPRRKRPEAPYPGLRAFENHETLIFFGRDRHTEEILDRLNQHRFVAVVGPSGCGKSSLIRAGVIPALKGGRSSGRVGANWRVALMRPENSPTWNLAKALYAELKPADHTAPDFREISKISSQLVANPSNGIIDVLKSWNFPENANLLIVVDQFEELFGLDNEAQQELRESFLNLILAIHRHKAHRAHCVITMRTDHLGDCARFRDLSDTINETSYLTSNLTIEELRSAIENPLELRSFRGQFADGLVDTILADMLEEEADQLPLMQHVLRRMWEAAKQEQPELPELTPALYKRFGGIKDAINQHAQILGDELKPKQKKLVPQLFKQLTERREGATYQEVRRPTSFKDLVAALNLKSTSQRKDLEHVINHFRAPDALFLRPQVSEELKIVDDTRIDIVHECLIRKWHDLKNWVAEEWNSAKNLYILAESVRGDLEPVQELGEIQTRNLFNWKKSEKPNAAWAQRYGITEKHFKRSLQHLEKHVRSIKESEELRRQELIADARRDEYLKRLQAEKLVEAQRKFWIFAFIGVIFSVSVVFGIVQWNQRTEAEAASKFWSGFSFISHKKQAHATLALELQDKSRTTHQKLTSTAEGIGKDISSSAKRIAVWADQLNLLTAQRSNAQSRFDSYINEILKKHEQIKNPIDDSVRQSLFDVKKQTVNTLDRNIIRIQREIQMRISNVAKSVRNFEGNISSVALSPRGDLIALALAAPDSGQHDRPSLTSPRVIVKRISDAENHEPVKSLDLQLEKGKLSVWGMKFSFDNRYLAVLQSPIDFRDDYSRWKLEVWKVEDQSKVADFDIPIPRKLLLGTGDQAVEAVKFTFANDSKSIAAVSVTGQTHTCVLSRCGSEKSSGRLILDMISYDLGDTETSSPQLHSLLALQGDRFGAVFNRRSGSGLNLYQFSHSDNTQQMTELVQSISFGFSAHKSIELLTCGNGSAILAIDSKKQRVRAWLLDETQKSPSCAKRFAYAEEGGSTLEVYQIPHLADDWKPIGRHNKQASLSSFEAILQADQHRLGAYEMPFNISRHSNDAHGVYVATVAPTFTKDQKLVSLVSVWTVLPGHFRTPLLELSNFPLSDSTSDTTSSSKQRSSNAPQVSVPPSAAAITSSTGSYELVFSRDYRPDRARFTLSESGKPNRPPVRVMLKDVHGLLEERDRTRYRAVVSPNHRFLAVFPEGDQKVKSENRDSLIQDRDITIWELQTIKNSNDKTDLQASLSATVRFRSAPSNVSFLSDERYISVKTQHHGSLVSAWKVTDLIDEVCARIKSMEIYFERFNSNFDGMVAIKNCNTQSLSISNWEVLK